LDQYLKRKAPKQEVIYYICGESISALSKSPLIQKLIAKDIEVLLLDDPIDEYCMNNLAEYEKVKLVNAAKADLKLDDEEKKKEKKFKSYFKPLLDWWKEYLGKKVEGVSIGFRLTNSPCIISTQDYGYTANMERITRAQAFARHEVATDLYQARKNLEINPSHPIIKKMLDIVRSTKIDDEFKRLADSLYDTALLNSGFPIEDTISYADKIEKLVRGVLSIPTSEQPAEVDIPDLPENDTEEVKATEQKQPEPDEVPVKTEEKIPEPQEEQRDIKDDL
jgi:HSP90 family molecular chaperone